MTPPKYTVEGRVNGAWLRAVREDAGISALELGKRIGRCAQFLRNVEHGDRPCSVYVCAAYEAIAQDAQR